MAFYLEIITDKNVHEVISILKNHPGVLGVREFDSVNYGEGYDVEIRKIPCRLYNENTSYSNGQIEVPHNFLNIEIDRHNCSGLDEQKEITEMLKKIITQNGLRSNVIPY